jgi:hypothetical protein
MLARPQRRDSLSQVARRFGAAGPRQTSLVSVSAAVETRRRVIILSLRRVRKTPQDTSLSTIQNESSQAELVFRAHPVASTWAAAR